MTSLRNSSIFVNRQWPRNASSNYNRVNFLGRGSSGTVWIARRRESHNSNGYEPTKQRSSRSKLKNEESLVVIKRIKNDKAAKVYAKREISILAKLNHPNIVSLIDSFDPSCQQQQSKSKKNQYLVMSLANGPNLQQLLDKGGALGLSLTRMIFRQVVAAVSYLHVRAVAHRDIKPSNCVLHGAFLDDDMIWSDGERAAEMVDSGAWNLVLVDFGLARAFSRDELDISELDDGLMKTTTKKNFRNLPRKVDVLLPVKHKDSSESDSFKLGRVSCSIPTPPDWAILSKQISFKLRKSSDEIWPVERKSFKADMMISINNVNTRKMNREKIPFRSMSAPSLKEETFQNFEKFETSENSENINDSTNINDSSNINVSTNTTLTTTTSTTTNTITTDTDVPQKINLRHSMVKSVSRNNVQMSFVGTRSYISPEMFNQAHRRKSDNGTAALTPFVTKCGLRADSYAVGIMMLELMMGVHPYDIENYHKQVERRNSFHPNHKYEETTSRRKSSLRQLISLNNASKKKKTPKNFRSSRDLPGQASSVIKQLTCPNPQKRITIREAQVHPWLAGQGENGEATYVFPQGDVPSGLDDDVIFLHDELRQSEDYSVVSSMQKKEAPVVPPLLDVAMPPQKSKSERPSWSDYPLRISRKFKSEKKMKSKSERPLDDMSKL